jgi:hypothetical protein
MMRWVAAAVVLAGWGFTDPAEAACPGVNDGGAKLRFTSTQLARPHATAVVAGGSIDIGYCAEVPGVGYVAHDPDFNVYYDRNDPNRDLEFRTESNCDTVLLVNTGDGNWFYDDDGASNGNARIRLAGPSAGRYDVWVGTYGEATCNARLIVESFR